MIVYMVIRFILYALLLLPTLRKISFILSTHWDHHIVVTRMLSRTTLLQTHIRCNVRSGTALLQNQHDTLGWVPTIDKVRSSAHSLHTSSYSTSFNTTLSTNAIVLKSLFPPLQSSHSKRHQQSTQRFFGKKKSVRNDRKRPTIEITKTSASSPLPPIIKPEDQIKEEEIRDIQAEIAFHHKHAQYHEALTASQMLLEKSMDHFQKNHPVTASAYNNVGLMHKYLGNFKEATDMYHAALRIYGEVVGKDHASYAATLNNLGNLLRAQTLMSDGDGDEENDGNGVGSMTALQRLQYNEMAIEYFEEALAIRQAELGKNHPHTITSHSNLGAAMASMLLQEQANRNRNKIKDGNKSSDSPSLKTSKFTATRWEAAEQHLRTALNTAVQNPRGKTISSSPPPQQEESSSTNASSFPTIKTLSAAGAAQNLAVFLKSKADILLQSSEGQEYDTNDMYAEALNLYQGALHVRAELLSPSHPDMIATKFSLAELLVAAYDDEEGANQLRQEILDAYNVEEKDKE